MNQRTFSDPAYEHKKKVTRKERFLNEMDKVLPWSLLLKPIRHRYPQGQRGRLPIPVEILLRIYLMQQWYGLSDPAMEDSLDDIESMRRFARVSLDRVPDETTLCKFRHYLERTGDTKKLFEVTESYLSERGLIVREGTIVDATIIQASSSRKNQQRARDEEMSSTKKGKNWYFGMKAHVGTDTKGRVHSVVVTSAAKHDSVVMEDLVHGEEQAVYGDKAYASAERQAEAERRGITWRVSRKAKRGRRLNAADRAFNRKSNRTRAQVFSLMAVANFYMTRRQLLNPSG